MFDNKTIENIVMLDSAQLVDHESYGEDITDTRDLETSMRDFGFTDPLEVTDYGMEAGMYTIVSGRRRRAAAINEGITSFPCIIKHFTSAAERDKYILYANNHRDTEDDPLLRARRYKMHEAQLREEGYKGSTREIIADRMGLSVQQADRYKQFCNVIPQAWDLVKDGVVAWTSLLPMSPYSPEEQNGILEALSHQHYAMNERLTRANCKAIIQNCLAGENASEGERIELPDAKLPHSEDITRDDEPIAGVGLRENIPAASETDGIADENFPDYSNAAKTDDSDSDSDDEEEDKPTKVREPREPMTEDERGMANVKKLMKSMKLISDLSNDPQVFEVPSDVSEFVSQCGEAALVLLSFVIERKATHAHLGESFISQCDSILRGAADLAPF